MDKNKNIIDYKNSLRKNVTVGTTLEKNAYGNRVTTGWRQVSYFGEKIQGRRSLTRYDNPLFYKTFDLKRKANTKVK